MNKKNSGSVLMSVLWVLFILSLMAAGLSKGTHVELSLVKNALGKTKSKYFAQAGVAYALDQIQQDKESNVIDTLYNCGIKFDSGFSPEQLFKDIPVGDQGQFSILYSIKGMDGIERDYYGFQDEESKINLNGLNAQNVDILIALLTTLDVDEEAANVISYSVIDWIDSDNVRSEDQYGAEDEYYESLEQPYKPKNILVDTKEELLLVRGVTMDIYQKMSPYVTIFPKNSNLKINFDTAREKVLLSLARAFTGLTTNTVIEDADSLVSKILDYRAGDDGVAFSEDDRSVDLNKMQLNAAEKTLFLMMNSYRTKVSQFLTANITGVDINSGINTQVEVIIQRNNLGIVYWHRN